MNLKILCFGFLMLAYMHGYTQFGGKILTLKDCIETAIGNNILVKQANLLSQTAEINLKQSRRDQVPDLTGNISHGLNQGRSIDPFTNGYINQSVGYANYNLSAGVILFNGFQLKNLVLQNRFGLEASKLEEQQVKDNISLNVILAYLQVLSLEDQLSQNKNQVILTTKQLERLDLLNKEGAIVPALFYDLKGQLATDQLTVLNTENALENSRLSLLQLMNLPYDKNIKLERVTADQLTSAYEFTATEVYNKALVQLASIRATELRTKTADKAIKAARGEFYPTVGLNGNFNTNFSSVASQDIFLNSTEIPSGDFVTVNGNKVPVITQKSNFDSRKIQYFNQLTNNYNTSLSLNIRVPILNASQARSRVALAKLDLKNAEYNADNTKLQLRQAIDQAWFNMTAAFNRYSLLLQQIKDYNESFKSAEVRFAAGVSTSVDYLIAKNNVDRANLNLISAKYDFLLRKKILDFYQGIRVF